MLKQQIAAGKLEEVFQTLLSNTEGTQHNEVVHLANRYAEYKANKNRGVLSDSEANLQRNRITESLLNLVDALPDDLKAAAKTNKIDKTAKSATKRNTIALISLAVAIIVLLFGNNIIGRFFPETEEALTLTIKVRDEQGNRPLKGAGELAIDYGNGTQTRPIDEEGKVDLREIPNRLKGNSISIVLEGAEGYEAIASQAFELNGNPITFKVQKERCLGIIEGKVRSRDGKQFLAGVLIEVASETTYSDSLGNFYMKLPEEKWKDEYTLFARKDGQLKEEKYYPNLEDFEIRLEY